MSGTVTYSQTNIPAAVIITPGPGVAFAGQGAAGVGFVAASIDANGRLQILRSDSVTVDAGKIGPVVAAAVPAGTNAATATPVSADVSLILAAVPGGALILQPGLNQARRIVNKLPTAVAVYPPPGGQIEALGAGVAITVAPGTAATLYSPDGVTWTAE